MTTAEGWAQGYLNQASFDLKASTDCGVPSVRAMLLQMALEKFGKAALLRTGRWTPERARGTHAAATEMLRVLDRRSCQKLGWAYENVRTRVAPLVDELERAQPQLAKGGPCLEYPWLGPTGEVLWPERDLPLAERFRAQRGDAMLLMNFAIALHRKFDRVYQAGIAP